MTRVLLPGLQGLPVQGDGGTAAPTEGFDIGAGTAEYFVRFVRGEVEKWK